jgi:hypothetical protein
LSSKKVTGEKKYLNWYIIGEIEGKKRDIEGEEKRGKEEGGAEGDEGML